MVGLDLESDGINAGGGEDKLYKIFAMGLCQTILTEPA